LIYQNVTYRSFKTDFTGTSTHPLNKKRTLPTLKNGRRRSLDHFQTGSIGQTNECTAGKFQLQYAFFIGPNLVAGHHKRIESGETPVFIAGAFDQAAVLSKTDATMHVLSFFILRNYSHCQEHE
jgi:hypothetical protein